jgi:hypothetical protein
MDQDLPSLPRSPPQVFVLFYDGGGERWLHDYTSLWTPHPREQVNSKPSIHVLYLVQVRGRGDILTPTSHPRDQSTAASLPLTGSGERRLLTFHTSAR